MIDDTYINAARAASQAAHHGSSDAGRRVAIVEDHLLQRRRTEELLRAQPRLEVVFSGETLPDFIRWLSGRPWSDRPHLLILDLMAERRPSADPEIVGALIDRGVRVLLFSALASPPLVRKMMRVGVHGIIGKRDSEAEIVAAVRIVLDGGEWITSELAAVIAQDPRRPQLSVQEERTLVLYASGLTIDAVATSIGVQPGTAKKYLQRVKSKYAAAGRPLRTKIEMRGAVVHDGLGKPDRIDAWGPDD